MFYFLSATCFYRQMSGAYRVTPCAEYLLVDVRSTDQPRGLALRVPDY
jgi:hypothetical protein